MLLKSGIISNKLLAVRLSVFHIAAENCGFSLCLNMGSDGEFSLSLSFLNSSDSRKFFLMLSLTPSPHNFYNKWVVLSLKVGQDLTFPQQ